MSLVMRKTSFVSLLRQWHREQQGSLQYIPYRPLLIFVPTANNGQKVTTERVRPPHIRDMAPRQQLDRRDIHPPGEAMSFVHINKSSMD